ncbi:MAG: stage V sporulation protein AC [Candidatus Fournierella pullistercoris]|uniref:Stage V sporulation protein AC n=1 Tax=Candidatus Allofournierella pullistercoris TaxID=2838597 RepID=A0A948T217_9FIRM|nr:stage V sporulation protein AC [Candidatus Fournierella pullistercoris]
MNPTKEQYQQMVEKASPPSRVVQNCLWAFGVGGGICLLGEVLRQAYLAQGRTLTDASTLTSITLVALSTLFTCLGWYHKLAVHAGAGTLVPITGFANAVVSPAVEFRCEGFVPGVGCKMFLIAGPVIVYGLGASALWGVVYYLLRPLLY